jgi:transcriptional regulator with XRE-family HTH domain
MIQRKKHTKDEISAKLAQAGEMAGQGKLQSEIASALGVSVMTLHRWRKGLTRPSAALVVDESQRFGDELGVRTVLPGGAGLPLWSDRIADLQLENSRLRRLVTDLLLEKMKLTEDMQNLSRGNGMKHSLP